MKYTVRFTHLKETSNLSPGDPVVEGDLIGEMGNSGASNGAHLHIDCVKGWIKKVFRMIDVENGKYPPAFRQLNYFIDKHLFDYPLQITTYFNCPEYMEKYGKCHMGYDVVPEDRKRTDEHYKMFWNRSKQGKVLAVGYDNGYGHYIHIGFNA